MKQDLPLCSGFNDYFGKFDCYAKHDKSCEECLCNWNRTGGLWHPASGRKWGRKEAIKYFGGRIPKGFKRTPVLREKKK